MFIIQRARFGLNDIIIRLLTSFIQEAQRLAHNLRRMNTYVDPNMSIFIWENRNNIFLLTSTFTLLIFSLHITMIFDLVQLDKRRVE